MKRSLVVALVAMVFILGACVTPTIDVAEQPSARITAPDLYAAYDNNTVAADALYKGKVVDVRGYIYNIGKDLIMDTPYVTLTDGGEYTMLGVQCMFTSNDERVLSSLHKGMLVTIRGRCDGQIFNVQLEGCILIDS